MSDAAPSARVPNLPETMRAWRVHEFGPEPTTAMQLERIPLPVPGPGELLVRAQGIPLNLNDMERVNGKNMMVRPQLPVTPGMETMGVVVACGAGTESWLGKRVVAMPKQATGGFAEYAICPTVSLPPASSISAITCILRRSSAMVKSSGAESEAATVCPTSTLRLMTTPSIGE